MWNDKEGWRLESVENVHMFVDFIPSEPELIEGIPSMEGARVKQLENSVLVMKKECDLSFCSVGEGNEKRYVMMDLDLGFEITDVPKGISLETLAIKIDEAFKEENIKQELQQFNKNILSWKLYDDVFADEIERVVNASLAMAAKVGDVLEKEIARAKNPPENEQWINKPLAGKELKTAVDYLQSRSVVNSSFQESIGYMARDMRKDLQSGVTVSQFEKETRKSIMENTSRSFQQVELAALSELVNGVKARVGEEIEKNVIRVRPALDNEFTVEQKHVQVIDKNTLLLNGFGFESEKDLKGSYDAGVVVTVPNGKANELSSALEGKNQKPDLNRLIIAISAEVDTIPRVQGNKELQNKWRQFLNNDLNQVTKIIQLEYNNVVRHENEKKQIKADLKMKTNTKSNDRSNGKKSCKYGKEKTEKYFGKNEGR